MLCHLAGLHHVSTDSLPAHETLNVHSVASALQHRAQFTFCLFYLIICKCLLWLISALKTDGKYSWKQDVTASTCDICKGIEDAVWGRHVSAQHTRAVLVEVPLCSSEVLFLTSTTPSEEIHAVKTVVTPKLLVKNTRTKGIKG